MQLAKGQTNLLIKYKRLLIASAALIVLVVAVLFVYFIDGQYLLLTAEQDGRILFCASAAQGSEFAMSFIHSVNKSPVTEYYRIENGQIFLESLHYYTFGAGMPSEPEQGQIMRFGDDGAIIIEGYNRHMTHLVYNIARAANHTLHWQGKEIPLNTLGYPGQPVLFSVITYPRLWMALHLFCFKENKDFV